MQHVAQKGRRLALVIIHDKSEEFTTKAALDQILPDLKRPSGPGNTTRELLDSVGVKSVNSIKNTYGITREQMQIRFQAELKRKQRRDAYRQKEGARAQG